MENNKPVCAMCGKIGTRWYQPLIGIEHFCSRACVNEWTHYHYTDGSLRMNAIIGARVRTME